MIQLICLHVWNSVSQQMYGNGWVVSGEQWCTKWKTLKSLKSWYKEVALNCSTSEHGYVDWEYLEVSIIQLIELRSFFLLCWSEKLKHANCCNPLQAIHASCTITMKSTRSRHAPARRGTNDANMPSTSVCETAASSSSSAASIDTTPKVEQKRLKREDDNGVEQHHHNYLECKDAFLALFKQLVDKL